MWKPSMGYIYATKNYIFSAHMSNLYLRLKIIPTIKSLSYTIFVTRVGSKKREKSPSIPNNNTLKNNWILRALDC